MTIKVTWERGHDRLPRLQWAFEDVTWSAFQQFGILHELTAGEALFEQGQASDALFIVRDGEMALVRDGKEIARVGRSVSFGERGLLLRRPRGASARAVTDTQVLELSRSDIDRMLEEAPVHAAHLYRVLAETLAEYLTLADDDER